MDTITGIKEIILKNKDLLEALSYIFGILAVIITAIIGIQKFVRYLNKKSSKDNKSVKIYKDCIKKENSHLDAEKLFGEQAFPLSLPEIFIPLYSNDPGIKQNQEKEMAQKQEPVDIEELIGKYDQLVIEGHAGSGKTTVLKHVAYSLVADTKYAKEKKIENYIPILLYLKYLNEYFARGDSTAKSGDILKWYLIHKVENCLEYEVLEDLIKAGRVLFLLDGLDELKPEHRDPLINTFINLQINNNKNKLVFSGRNHGITVNLVNKFENRHVRVNDLNNDQINEFIRKWFKYLYKGETVSGTKTAEELIGDVKDNEATEQLKSNPLMLTAICILYHDDRELPAQRAELYKKFIDNMLYRRFGNDYKKILEYLGLLAFGMHEKGVRATGKYNAIKNLSEVFPIDKGEKDSDYKHKIIEKFEDIEPKCGLLKFENGEYSFWHLSFQEYLCALYIANKSDDTAHGIDQYWGNKWYKEVIELYIGYLSISSKATANKIVENALNGDRGEDCNKWIIAAKSLYDIHKDRRAKDVENHAREKLENIFEIETKPKVLAEAGEILGWLGDKRNLEEFVTIPRGIFELEGIGIVSIKEFELLKYPVTNIWYKRFIDDGKGYSTLEYWTEQGKEWLKRTGTTLPRHWNDRKWNCSNAPVVGVSWYEADAFCKWLTKIDKEAYKYYLPIENEWQSAAAGKEKREYPWVGEWNKEFCNSEESGIDKTSSVGIFIKGKTPDDIFEMAGNVWEWTRTNYETKMEQDDFKTDEYPALRGGSWFNNHEDARCAYRYDLTPEYRNLNIGFRCVRTLK